MVDRDSDWIRNATVSADTLTFFSRQMATMLGAGLSLTESIECILSQYESSNFRSASADAYEALEFGHVLEEILRSLSSGASLSEAASSFSKIFPHFYLAMLKVGEDTGALVVVLHRLTTWLERRQRIRQKVRAALTYPIFLLGLSLFLTGGLFLFFIPRFEEIFQSMQGGLPLVTRILLVMADLAQSPGTWLLGTAGIVAISTWLVRTWQSEDGKLWLYRILSRVPVLGDLLYSASVARFCATARLSLSSGQDLVRTIELAVGASDNPMIQNDLQNIKASVIDGRSLSEHLTEFRDLYDGLLILMVATGEESGKLEMSFEKASEIYDQRVDYLVENLSAISEPLLLAGVGGMIGVVLISVFLPMYNAISSL